MKWKGIELSLAVLAAVAFASGARAAKNYRPTWESLKRAPIPEWIQDAKFGVYTHWGVYSVPAFQTNTYGRDIYCNDPNAPEYEVRQHHERTYGSVFSFGYKDIIPRFTAPKFDAAEWARVMHDAGAKFGGICVVHHDGFCLWDSQFTRWNSARMGPKRDIYGEIAREIRRAGLKLLATFHHARTHGFYYRWAKTWPQAQRKKLDLFDPAYADFYRNPEHVSKDEFGTEWHNKINEVIAKYQPDVIWFDGLAGPRKNGTVRQGDLLRTFAHYYNHGTPYADQVVVCNKLPSGKVWNFPPGFGLRCYENGRDMEADPRGTWLIDRAISYPWTYVQGKKYPLTYRYHIASLVDLVARGGIFLISLTPKGDGSIPDEEKCIMGKIGQWLRVNGEGIYGTRPWRVVGEGIGVDQLRKVMRDPKRPGQRKARWDFHALEASRGAAIRFTRSKDFRRLYAFVIGVPERGEVTIQSLRKGRVEESGRGIRSVTMLGSDENIPWRQTAQGLTVRFPEKLPCEVAYGFKIQPNGRLDHAPRQPIADGIERIGDWPLYNTTR